MSLEKGILALVDRCEISAWLKPRLRANQRRTSETGEHVTEL